MPLNYKLAGDVERALNHQFSGFSVAPVRAQPAYPVIFARHASVKPDLPRIDAPTIEPGA